MDECPLPLSFRPKPVLPLPTPNSPYRRCAGCRQRVNANAARYRPPIPLHASPNSGASSRPESSDEPRRIPCARDAAIPEGAAHDSRLRKRSPKTFTTMTTIPRRASARRAPARPMPSTWRSCPSSTTGRRKCHEGGRHMVPGRLACMFDKAPHDKRREKAVSGNSLRIQILCNAHHVCILDHAE